jgi:type IV secretion system protein VirB9
VTSEPLRAFDHGERVHVQFPAGIAQGELPPFLVVGPVGLSFNYRYRTPK